MHIISSSSVIRALLVVPVALAFAACTYPEPVGEAQTEAGSDDGSGGSGSETTAGQTSTSLPNTTTTTEGTGDTETTGDVDTTTSTDTDATTNGTATSVDTETSGSETSGAPELPPGMCWSEFHGEYWCECTARSTELCGDDGIRVCFYEYADVVTHEKWGPCGECEPGQQVACDIEGAPGRQFCNVLDLSIDDINDLPTPAWGACILDEDIVCEPGESMMCNGEFVFQTCDIDEQGAPYWTAC